MILRSHGNWCSGKFGPLLVSSCISATERVTSGNKDSVMVSVGWAGVVGLGVGGGVGGS